MEGLLFLFGLFLALGLFFLTASVLKLPTMGAAKAMLGTVKQEQESGKDIGNLFYDPSSADCLVSSGWMHIREAGCRMC